jgi:Na+/glutamate symporter
MTRYAAVVITLNIAALIFAWYMDTLWLVWPINVMGLFCVIVGRVVRDKSS